LDGYRVIRDGVTLAETTDPFAEVALLGDGLDAFQVHGVFSGVQGDGSDVLELNSAVPRIVGFEPEVVFQGDEVRAEIRGENLLLMQDDVYVDLGEGVESLETVVRDVNTAVMHLKVSADAGAGFRSIALQSGDIEVVSDGVLEVLSGEERPQIVSVVPDLGRQASVLEVELRCSEELAPLQSVDFGAGVWVQEWSQPSSDRVLVKGWIDLDAPLGERVIRLDDGQRVWTGVVFDVLDRSPPPVGCGHVSRVFARASWGLWLAGLGLISFRRRNG